MNAPASATSEPPIQQNFAMAFDTVGIGRMRIQIIAVLTAQRTLSSVAGELLDKMHELDSKINFLAPFSASHKKWFATVALTAPMGLMKSFVMEFTNTILCKFSSPKK